MAPAHVRSRRPGEADACQQRQLAEEIDGAALEVRASHHDGRRRGGGQREHAPRPQGGDREQRHQDRQRRGLRSVEDGADGEHARQGCDRVIAGARAALAAAGIAFEVSGSANPVTAGAEGALAISVREAVTNVVRHSGASHC
jgi:hypothetical protein